MKITRRTKKILRSGSVDTVGHHEGKPGGPNNDQVRLHMSTGYTVVFDAYNPGILNVTVLPPEDLR